MKIYIVRHAQSKRNAKIKSGEDTELTNVGEEQARRLGQFFHDVELTKIYCSPLKRAKTTFEKIKPFVERISISFPKEIIEIKMGKHSKNGKDDWGSYFKEASKLNIPPHLYRPKNGESLQDCYNRAGKFYLNLLKKHSHKDNLLIVGHGFFLMYLILNALGLDASESKYYQLNNASISLLKINKQGKIKDFHINDYNHLIREAIKLKSQNH